MKKTLALTLALVLALASSCAFAEGKLFMSSALYTCPYGAPMQQAVTEKAKELGYEIVIQDGEENADKQLSQFKAAVEEGVYDGLIYWPGDQASTPPVVEYLNSTGLPWVDINTIVDNSILDKVPCIVASDEVEIGRWLGRLILEYFETNETATKNVVYIEGTPGSSYTTNLTIGVDEILNGSDVVILNDHQYAQYDPSKAMAIMEDLLTKYGSQIDLVVCQDGGMFQGAYTAIESSGYLGEMGIICQGQDLIVREKLESGELYASVAQDPYTEGSITVEMLDKMIKGEEVEHWIYTPTGPIYAADIDNYTWF